MALWSGRFTEDVSEFTQEFGASLPVDKQLYKQDIAGSVAHARMLGAQGIIAKEDAAAIEAGLTYAGVTYRPCSFEPAGDRLYRVTLREGKYHEIKFMIDYAGVRLLSLKRISFGGIALDESLAPGEMRALTPQELDCLRNQTGEAG